MVIIMHEMSIVEALLDAMQQAVRPYPGATVRSARVRVGQLRLIVPETMQFCFAAATRDTPLAGCRLELEEVPATARCRSCRQEFRVADDWFLCPRCGAVAEVLTGRELDLVSLELEQPQTAECVS
jgi:hydrogenase nickel incorporation protein HypA/HybF